MKTLGRVLTAMITPFNADGSIDFEGAVTLAKHLLNNGSVSYAHLTLPTN